jgi:two-component system NarL family response regulator
MPEHSTEGGSSAERLRVVVVDDHPFYRQGLIKLLMDSGIEVVGEAANGAMAIDVVEQTAPDVVVVDLRMPGLSGVETTRRLCARTPSSRVLVLSVSDEESDVTDAILAGALGYVVKDAPVEQVIAGIRAAAAGQSLISPRIASMLLRSVPERERAELYPPPVGLSAREREVLKLVADGKANHEIGETLSIRPSTVRNHISSILMKLQVDNRVQAAVRAVRERML